MVKAHTGFLSLVPAPVLTASLLPVQGTASSWVVAHSFQLRPEKGAGALVRPTQIIDGDYQVPAGILALLKPAAHKQGIIRTGLDAKATEHTPLNLYIKDFQAVFIALLGGRVTGAGHNLDDTQGTVLGAGSAAGATLLIPDKLFPSEPGMLFQSFLGVLDGERLFGHILQGNQQALNHR
jgi:hypothetical protein